MTTLFLLLCSGVAVAVVGPRYEEAGRATRAMPHAEFVGVSFLVMLALIIVVGLLLSAGLTFVFMLIDAWLLLLLVPTVFAGAVNVSFDRHNAVRMELRVEGKELLGRYGQVTHTGDARAIIPRLGGWYEEPIVRAVPESRLGDDAATQRSVAALCVHPGALGRPWIEAPSLRSTPRC